MHGWLLACAVASWALGGYQTAPLPSAPSELPTAAAPPAACPAAPPVADAPATASTEATARQTLDAIRQLLDLGQEEAAAARLEARGVVAHRYALGRWFVSLAHGDDEIAATLAAVRGAVGDMAGRALSAGATFRA